MSPAETPSPRSKPNRQACTNCHRRKVRCDFQQGQTCTNCKTKNLSACQLHEKKRKNISRTQPIRTTPLLKPRSTSQRLTTRAYQPAPAPTRERCSEEGNLAEFVTQETVRGADINNQDRMCFIGSEPSNFNYLIRKGSSHPVAESQVFHFSNRQYHHCYTSHHLDKVSSEALEIPEQDIVDELVETYFRHINRCWPILDEESFYEQLRSTDPRNAVSPPLLNAVLLVGAHVLSFEDRDGMRELQTTFFRRAKILMDSRFEQDRLVYIQVALLMTWYSDGLEEVIANAWYWVGAAARAAIGLGMHRNTVKAKLVPAPKRMWVRVFWVLFQFDTLISLSYGRPQCLNMDECDVVDLTPDHFVGSPNANADFAIHHARLCIIMSHAMKHRWSLRGDVSSRILATRQADDSLAHLISHLPSSLQRSSCAFDACQAAFLINYNNFLLLLHRAPPLLPEPTADDEQLARAVHDSDICADACMALVSLFQDVHCSNTLQSISLLEIHAIFTTVVSIMVKLDNANPLVATKAMRMLKSVGVVLRELAPQWNLARGLACLVSQTEARFEASGHRDGREAGQLALPQPPNTRSASLATGAYPNQQTQPATTMSGLNSSVSSGETTPLGDISHFLGDFTSQESLALDDFLASMDTSFQFFY